MRVVSIPLGSLVADPEQPRRLMSSAELESLVGSIRARGLLLPLRVTPADAAGRHVIVSGHRRHAALAKIGAATVACVVADGPLDEATTLAEQIAENVFRESLTPIDEAQAYHRYLALRAITAAQAAVELQVSASRISRMLPLLDLPDRVQAAVHAGAVPKETAYYLSRLPAGDERTRLIAQALSGSLSRDTAARAAKTLRQATADSPCLTRVSCKLPAAGTLTLSGPAITLETFIDVLEGVLKEARKGRAQGWDVSTLARVFRDRAAKGGVA